MPASVGGIVTLLICAVVGPCCLGLYEFLSRRKKAKSVETAAVNPASAGDDLGRLTITGSENQILQDEGGREVVSTVEYVLGLLGYAIGIGNVWRFPYLCGRNGGAAFLIAYFFCLFFVSMPAYMMEFVMGQYTRQSTIGCYKAIHPAWQGLGWSQAFMLFWVLAYYNILLGYAIIYIVGSCSDPFPWAPDKNQIGGEASRIYFQEGVLNKFPDDEAGKHGFGPCEWDITIAVLCVWIICFFSLGFGKQILAKVTWVTVVGPLILLVILLCRVLALEAADEGVAFYIGKFEGSRLGDIGVWRDACVQILFSLSPGMGTAITMSSFTKPRENVYRTCWLVACSNSGFSFVGGFAIFSIVGNITYKINLQRVKDNLDPLGEAVTNLNAVGQAAQDKAAEALSALGQAAAASETKIKNCLTHLKETSFQHLLKSGDLPGVIAESLSFDESATLSSSDEAKWSSVANSIKTHGATLATAALSAVGVLNKVHLDENHVHTNTGRLEHGAAFFARQAIGYMQALNTSEPVWQAVQSEVTPDYFSEMNETFTLQPIAKTARSGSGLAFIAIADGMQTFGEAKNVISVLFFLMLLTLGLDSTFAWAETFVSYMDDGMRALGKTQKKITLVGVFCVVMFLAGLPYCTRYGLEALDVVDNYVGLNILLFGVPLECVIFLKQFGFDRFVTALKTASGVTLDPVAQVYWRLTLFVTVPIIPTIILCWVVVEGIVTPYGGYADWLNGIGWFLFIVCIILIPIGAAKHFYHDVKQDGYARTTLDQCPGAKIADAYKAVEEAKAMGVSPKPAVVGSQEPAQAPIEQGKI